ncbi:Tetracycline resistance protein TetA/multidrug resistance protein MdtG [Penicillium tannophilum]|nr:Tetracycline resistance protein TetA/multidrug resistance protein MdtG [Penicillium tannophilum]
MLRFSRTDSSASPNLDYNGGNMLQRDSSSPHTEDIWMGSKQGWIPVLLLKPPWSDAWPFRWLAPGPHRNTISCCNFFDYTGGRAGTTGLCWERQHGGKVYIVSVTAMGALRPLVSGLGPQELTGELWIPQQKSKNILRCCQRASRKDPEHFGPEGLSRVFAMMKTASSIGMIIGPLLGGALRIIFGYDYMSWTWSECLSFLAGMVFG